MNIVQLCVLPVAVSIGAQAHASRELSAWARSIVRPSGGTADVPDSQRAGPESQAPAVAARQCVATQMGSPCQQGGIATLGASRPVPDFGMGNPADLRSGNKYQRDTDLPSLWDAPGLELVRHYNALDPRHGPLGQGWSWSYDTRLYRLPSGIQIVQADGSRLDFTCGQARARAVGCRAPDAMHGRIEALAAGWRWRWPGGTVLRFDGDGLLVQIDHGAGSRLDIRRYPADATPAGAIDEVVARPSGARLQFRYAQAAGLRVLSEVQTPQGTFLYRVDAPVDGLPRLVAVTRPDGMLRRYHHESQLQAGHANALTGISIAHGVSAPAVRTHAWHYDASGRVSRFVAGEPGGQPDGLPIVYADEALGLDAQRDADGAIRMLRVPARGWPGLRLDFDANGAMTAWSAQGVQGERLVPGRRGGLLAREFVTGARWQWHADRHGRIVSMRARSPAETIETRVDWRGTRPVLVHHPNESQTLRHDRQGHLRERVISRPGVGREPGFRLTERFRYDPNGRRTSHALPEGGVLHYAWTPASRLMAIAWEDASGVRHPVLEGTAAGLRHGNGLVTAGLVAARGLSALLLYQPETQSAPYLHSLAYDARGQIAREVVQTDDGRQTTIYAHDAAGRLAGARSWRTPPGSFYPSQVKQRHFAWRTSGEAFATWGEDGQARPDIVRDATGLPVRVGPFLTTYGAQRRLVRASRADDPAVRVEYGHNAVGERIWRDDGAGRTHYFYDAHRLGAEAQTPGGTLRFVRRYIHAGQVPVAMIDYTPSGAQLFMIHADPVGLPRLVTDRHRRVRWQGRFSPTGQLLAERGDLRMPLRLPGQVADPVTGWHDNYQRTYDPAWGHFLEPDPLGPVPGNSLYGYADQQPRRHADPLGLMLFAFDGTGNRPESLTNVWLMAQSYRDGVVHYMPGPGTAHSVSAGVNASDSALAWSGAVRVDSHWERLLNALANQQSAARPVPLDIVGFSRGAALGRDFGNRVARHVREGRFWARHPLHGIVTQCVDLRFMGLFDTVAQFNALGAGNAAFDLTIAPAWKWVAHAVALHERRWLFPLTSALGASNVVERAFVGAHADIGGGYLTPQASPGSTPGDLSHVALAWMQWQARAAGVGIDGAGGIASVRAPVIHDERAVFSRRLQDSDRRVNRADGMKWVNYQADLPLMGRQLRRDVESFIARRPHPLLQGADAVGLVDMEGYARWLERTTGLR